MEPIGNDILALNDLFQKEASAMDGNEHDQASTRKPTPANITSSFGVPNVTRPIGQIRSHDSKAIWQIEEVPSDDEEDNLYENRKRPAFEILYKQDVMAEDIFLGLSDKDPSSAHCEAMVVRIECPGHKVDEIELDVTKDKLFLQSTTLKLSLSLPHSVRSYDSNAVWDSKKEILAVTLPIIRDDCLSTPHSSFDISPSSVNAVTKRRGVEILYRKMDQVNIFFLWIATLLIITAISFAIKRCIQCHLDAKETSAQMESDTIMVTSFEIEASHKQPSGIM